MKGLLKYTVLIAFMFAIFSSVLVHPSYAQANPEDNDTIYINEWEMKWETNPDATIEDIMSQDQAEGWFPVSYGEDLPEKPEGIHVAWLRFRIPDVNLIRPVLYLSKLTAKNVFIYVDQQQVYSSNRNYNYNKNEILLPLQTNEEKEYIYLKLQTNGEWLGLKEPAIIGEYKSLSKTYMNRGILDVILGASLLFIALTAYLCVIFLNKSYLVSWFSLSTIVLSVGLMILSYSPFLLSAAGRNGVLFYYFFDIASSLLMPAIYIFFENIFGKGPYGIISKIRKIQIITALLNIVFSVVGIFSEDIKDGYMLIGLILFALCVVIGNIILVVLLIIYCTRNNKDAIILTVGFGMFSAIGVTEIIWYFAKERSYDVYFWKWGVLSFLASLLIILVRRIMENYEQVVKYSKQLEVFNNELQRSEKMEMISQLAASVAHEVRNPLQVTRGFLQLLGHRTAIEKDKGYMNLAIEELDRASEIITDFLTFAKPQIEKTNILNLADEINQIEGILVPLATMQGGIIKSEVMPDLYVKGNSSKFKQALINIIKNSVEAFKSDGLIEIYASRVDSNEIIIRIKDNGEGIHESDLIRLGEPYYSKKTKGTGLGLMVTFRIIELMGGRLEYSSVIGEGTEAIIYLPCIEKTMPNVQ
ncbi:ATP-binding protein [Paenibacillus harenae]|uniref:histidine kinase n=1 Tax=Paenibacillus harenae TaxID=306543 RepID=A0ABT9U800_PAEHA|nr:ATP-binding protein [Paenibacillus harenae]MDQ0115762.1 signal transduction histidine kinase [Paenibacillus harenae]